MKIESRNLLVLGENRLLNGPKRYRGTYRRSPDYQAQFSATHEVNQAFGRFCELGGQSLALSDVDFARNMVRSYRRLNPPQKFDLIHAMAPGRNSELSNTLLGYDICCEGIGNSMLSWGLELTHYSSEAGTVVKTLIRLIEEMFKPLLNGNGLFDSSDSGQFCLDCMRAINAIAPGYFESDLGVYQVTALYLVPVDSEESDK